jgi:hypothetical protein
MNLHTLNASRYTAFSTEALARDMIQQIVAGEAEHDFRYDVAMAPTGKFAIAVIDIESNDFMGFL